MKKLSNRGKDLISNFEGLRLKPYKCSAGIPTIGIGCTYYENHQRVKMTDPPITKERAYELFNIIVKPYESAVNSFVKSNINQNQFDALVSLCYNIGVGNFSQSSVLKQINIDPNSDLVEGAWKLWVKSKGKTIPGLMNRRIKEIEYYKQK